MKHLRSDSPAKEVAFWLLEAIDLLQRGPVFWDEEFCVPAGKEDLIDFAGFDAHDGEGDPIPFQAFENLVQKVLPLEVRHQELALCHVSEFGIPDCPEMRTLLSRRLSQLS